MSNAGTMRLGASAAASVERGGISIKGLLLIGAQLLLVRRSSVRLDAVFGHQRDAAQHHRSLAGVVTQRSA